jgi:hypothetical protein
MSTSPITLITYLLIIIMLPLLVSLGLRVYSSPLLFFDPASLLMAYQH